MKSTQKAAGQIRIIGGEHRRQLIPVLNHEGLRPSSDRVRETVFNWMMHQWGGVFDDKLILDAFTGSGAFGLECVSRGATHVWMIDTHAPTVAHIRKTLKQWQTGTDIQAQQADALKFCAQAREAGRIFDWIILDPPFGHNWLTQIMPAIMPVTHHQTWLYVEVETAADLSLLTDLGWTEVRSGKTQQVRYGLWQRVI
jgi:16S rRNA (guanine966-N2)-methyltransferase